MFTIDNKARKFTFILMAIGLVALIFGFVSDYLHYQEDPKHHFTTWPAILFNTYFYLGIALFAVFFVALQYVAEAGWSIVLKESRRRLWEHYQRLVLLC